MKRLFRILVVVACVWLFLFQGTSKFSSSSEVNPSHSILVEGTQTSFSSYPVVLFGIFVIFLFACHKFLTWWSYDRNIRLLSDQELEENARKKKK